MFLSVLALLYVYVFVSAFLACVVCVKENERYNERVSVLEGSFFYELAIKRGRVQTLSEILAKMKITEDLPQTVALVQSKPITFSF